MGGGDRRWSVVLLPGLFFATLAALAAALAAAVAAGRASPPRVPKSVDAATAMTPSGLPPLQRLASDVPVVQVVEGADGTPLEIRVHLPNGFPGAMP